jgi:hypothetical protein
MLINVAMLLLMWIFNNATVLIMNRDSSVGIALGYGLEDRGSKVRFPVGAGNFSLHNSVQKGSGAHPASYPMGTRGSFPEGKTAGAWSWPLTSIKCRGQRMRGAIPQLPQQYAFMAWCVVKHRDNFTFTFLLLYFYAFARRIQPECLSVHYFGINWNAQI